MKKMMKLFWTVFCMTALWACARQGALSGGAKDTQPPKVDTLHSTPNFATRFHPKQLEFRFNEWIVLSDANAQVVVSPPLVKRPEVTLRGKKVIVKFDANEKFRDSTTYTVNFGTAVKDLHENNPAKDLRFVFSTGDFIDSLTVKGRITDAFSGDALENIAVMLYDQFADSVVRKDRPYYFSRTDKTGLFEIRNVKSGAFKICAVEDLDQNLRWDGENERIGFSDTSIQVYSGNPALLGFQLFKNEPKLRLLDKYAGAYGILKLKFNGNADTVTIRPLVADSLSWLTERTQDSIIVWYDRAASGAWSMLVAGDTIAVKALSKDDFLKKHPVMLAVDVPASAGGRKLQTAAPAATQPVKFLQQSSLKPAQLVFNYPIVGTDTSRWQLLLDSVRVSAFTARTDSAQPRQVSLAHDWKAGKTYQMALFPGAVTDFWGQTNADTIRRIITIPADKQLGTLTLTVENLKTGHNYYLQLLNGNTVEEERYFKAEANQQVFLFEKLAVATYSARVVDDVVPNRRWDTGDYWRHRQAETTVLKKLEALRANWEVQSTLSLPSENFEKKKKKGK